MLTQHEQFFAELTNRLRLNPQAEADRLLGGEAQPQMHALAGLPRQINAADNG